MFNEQLKQMIDAHGLFAVVEALSGVCGQISERCTGSGVADWKAAEASLNAAAEVILDHFEPRVTDTIPYVEA